MHTIPLEGVLTSALLPTSQPTSRVSVGLSTALPTRFPIDGTQAWRALATRRAAALRHGGFLLRHRVLRESRARLAAWRVALRVQHSSARCLLRRVLMRWRRRAARRRATKHALCVIVGGARWGALRRAVVRWRGATVLRRRQASRLGL